MQELQQSEDRARSYGPGCLARWRSAYELARRTTSVKESIDFANREIDGRNPHWISVGQDIWQHTDRHDKVWKLYHGSGDVNGIWYLEISGGYYGSTDEFPGLGTPAAIAWAARFVR